jgi:anti-sigma regulatory factor (Ser/Thr protein kinase)
MNESLALSVTDRSQTGEARRAAAIWGRHRGWSEEMAGRIALIVTELGNNLALHTSGGTLFLRGLVEGAARGVEILSIDAGPGVANFSDCLRDGYSTAGTAGTGLGAVKRASQLFATHSQPGVGTALLSEVWAMEPASRAGRFWHCGALSIAMGGDPVSGDSWSEQHLRPEVIRVMIADGLGHGEFAAQASIRAVEVFEKSPTLPLPDLMQRMHDALRPTRGAAVSIAELDLAGESVSYVGVGNITGTIVTHDKSASLVSMNGTVGGVIRGIKQFNYPWPQGGSLVMMSDGIKSHWNVKRYAGLLDRHPSLITGVLYRDYARGTDDATVLTVRPVS